MVTKLVESCLSPTETKEIELEREKMRMKMRMKRMIDVNSAELNGLYPSSHG